MFKKLKSAGVLWNTVMTINYLWNIKKKYVCKDIVINLFGLGKDVGLHNNTLPLTDVLCHT